MGCFAAKVQPKNIEISKNINETATKENVKKPEVEIRTFKPEKRVSKVSVPSLIPDNRIQLTSRQKFQVLKSLKGIEREITDTGIKMFLRMFKNHKDTMKLFADFAGYNVDELDQCPELEGHVTMVMNTIDEAISSLDDIDYVIHMLHSIGKRHRSKVEYFDPGHFWNIEGPFLEAVKETLGDRYTANMENIYRITIRFILETMIEGCYN